MAEAIYIKCNAVYQKLRRAEQEQTSIYLHAPVGTGKTAAVRYYYRYRKCRWLSGEKGYLPELPEQAEEPLIIDDISWITDRKSREDICRLIGQEGVHVVLLGRSRMSSWLVDAYASGRLMMADERDMLLDTSRIAKMCEAYDCPCTPEEAERILADTKGFALEVRMLIPHLLRVGSYQPSVLSEARQDCFRFYNQSFFDKWDREVQNLLLCVAEFPQFDVELARMVSGSGNVPRLLEYACEVGDFLIRSPDNRYSLRPKLTEYLLWKRSVTWNEAKYRSVYRGASLCYEVQGDIQSALAMAGKNRDEVRTMELLLKNARKNPGIGHYAVSKDFYFSLPEKKLEESPTLISGMSLLYSLLLQPEKSEEWYEILREFLKKHKSDVDRCREASNRLAYLDLVLPHRGIGELATILKHVAALRDLRGLSLPEISVTDQLPSVINGGKDFSDWTPLAEELAVLLRKPLEGILKESGVGLVDIALAESAYEKAEKDDYQIMSLLNNGYAMAETGGRMETCFAAVGIQARFHIGRGNLNLAVKQLRQFLAKAEQEQAKQLLPNLDALLTRTELLKGNLKQIREWMETAPNETSGFQLQDRYQYLVKLRCYIALGDYDAAWNLSERLEYYFTAYDRHYMEIENRVLRAILSKRLGRDWQELFRSAYERAKSYHFIWVIAQEGIAVLPLLRELKPEEPFQQELIEKARQMSLYYQDYLKKDSALKEPLTGMEKQILRLHTLGKTTKQITELCEITENTLKFHNKNLYKKLGAGNKNEAVQIAKQLGLIS